jgi:hypothetical protein
MPEGADPLPGRLATGVSRKETFPGAIRDLAESSPATGVWLPAINVATGGPQSHVVYHELVKHARMRLTRTTEGSAMVTVTESGAVHLFKVPSPEFYRFVDRFRVARSLRVLPEPALEELARIIQARVSDPGFVEDQTGVPTSEPPAPPEGLPAHETSKPGSLDFVAYALNRLVFRSPYVFVPSALTSELGKSEEQIARMFIEHHSQLRELGFDARPVSSSLGPVFLVTRLPTRDPRSTSDPKG